MQAYKMMGACDHAPIKVQNGRASTLPRALPHFFSAWTNRWPKIAAIVQPAKLTKHTGHLLDAIVGLRLLARCVTHGEQTVALQTASQRPTCVSTNGHEHSAHTNVCRTLSALMS